MPISNESKRAIRQQIEVLNTQKKIAENDLAKAAKQKDKFQARVNAFDASIAKLESDLV